MAKVGKEYRSQLVEQVRAVGKELVERADELVGGGDLISDYYIYLRFPQGGGVPTIEATTEYVSKEAINVIMKEDKS